MIELMAIQNNPKIAAIYDEAGIDRVFVDLENIGKVERQKHINAVLNYHTIQDVINVKKALKKSKLLVRINPIHKDSKDEILKSIDAGADIIMLPMFKTMYEVESFFKFTSNKVKTTLLFETAESICLLSEACKIKELNEIYVGLNDMHLSLNMSFLFEPLVYGIVDLFSKYSQEYNKSFGFGGLATLEGGVIAGKHILTEHARLNSKSVILSRAFFGAEENILSNLKSEVSKIKELYNNYQKECDEHFYIKNRNFLKDSIKRIVNK